jgi:hypothetical protein
MKKLTMRERILAVVQGESVDRVPFVMYDGLLPTNEVRSHIGAERIGLLRWSRIHRVNYPNCKTTEEEFVSDGLKCRRKSIHTAKGTIFEQCAFEPEYGSSSIRKHFISKPEEYEVLWSYLEDAVIEEDFDTYNRDAAELGDDGIPLVAVERTPYQQLWVEWVGLESLSYHFLDFPDLVNHTVELLERRQKRIMELATASPAPFIDFPDNITATAIGCERFKQYCTPAYRELSGMLSESGRHVFVHMDGDLKPLWKEIADSGIRGIDSFSPAPENDTSLEEALSLRPDMRIFMNFPSSVHLQSRELIKTKTRMILETGADTGRLQIQLSENVPFRVWKNSLSAIADAIDDFYGP